MTSRCMYAVEANHNAWSWADLQDRSCRWCGGWQVEFHSETLQEQVRREPQLYSWSVCDPTYSDLSHFWLSVCVYVWAN